MNRRAEIERDRLSSGIKGQLGSDMTRRFVRSLPLFRAVETLPGQFRELLDELDECEGGRRRAL